MIKEKVLKKIRVATDCNSAEIGFAWVVELEASHPENDSETKKIPVKGVLVPYRPHKDLTDSMKKLRKFALEALGIELADESKQLKEWIVPCIELAGDHTVQQARVKITLGKLVESTGKVAEIKTGQITMYPSAEEKAKYPNADKIAPIVEDIIEEVWSYLNGKHENKTNPQLALFPDVVVEA